MTLRLQVFEQALRLQFKQNEYVLKPVFPNFFSFLLKTCIVWRH